MRKTLFLLAALALLLGIGACFDGEDPPDVHPNAVFGPIATAESQMDVMRAVATVEARSPRSDPAIVPLP